MNAKRTLMLTLALAAGTSFALAQTTATEEDEVLLDEFNVTAMKAFSDQAIPNVTPVAYSELGRDQIAAELGSRDLPLVLNSTPSLYASTDGGGAGDSRVNVRGFNQRNISILINGVPTNDIENGWLYWSNWDGLGDVSTSIQIQRGLSNVTLPTPSIGGTINIITEPANDKMGFSAKLEMGDNGFNKQTFVASTGLLADRFALTAGLVVKSGDGYVRGTFTEGKGYYLGATWKINDKHRLELFAISAPQRHGQRSFASNIAAYDTDYARELGYSDADIGNTTGSGSGAGYRGPLNAGHDFNPNFAPVDSNYTGKQWYWGGLHSRQYAGFLNERENYFDKPQVNMNWYATLSDRASLTSVLYYSGGRGGGSGTLYNTYNVYGYQSSSRAFAYVANSDSLYGSAIDWDTTIAANAGTSTVRGDRTKVAGESLAILRNSVNNQDQWGLVSKLAYEVTDELKLTTGVDWRIARIDHFREVRDLLGGDYYVPSSAQSSEFWASNSRLGLGDKVDYYNTNRVRWLGGFLQGQYEIEKLYAFATMAYSETDYGFVDHFRRASEDSSDTYRLGVDGLDGKQIKGGVKYSFTDNLSAFVNAGWVSKAPIFDGAINDTTGSLVDPNDEKFTSMEAGVRFETKDRKLNVTANVYMTRWRDRTITTVSESAGTITYQRNVNSDDNGIEIESEYSPIKMLKLKLTASFGDWTYTGNSPVEVYDIESGEEVSSSGVLYIDGLKVGDQPQTQITYAATVTPIKGLRIKLQGRYNADYYADYDPITRTSSSDRGQAWQIPSFTLYDLHVSYNLPLNVEKLSVELFAHVFNLLDETYVSDATDNSSYEGVSGAASHSAQRAEVFLGAPRTFNAGVRVRF